MDIIDRLNDPETYIDAIDDAITEIKRLREKVLELRRALETEFGAIAGAIDGQRQAKG